MQGHAVLCYPVGNVNFKTLLQIAIIEIPFLLAYSEI